LYTNGSIVLDLGKEIKKHVQSDNMLAWQYNTIGVSDGITMGGEGMAVDVGKLLHGLTISRNALLPPDS
jgi:dihydroxyacid dehydratase/phosphogluconate dehydratase